MSKYLDLDQAVNDIKQRLQRKLSPNEMARVANFAINEIKERSRRGYGVDPQTLTQKPFPRLSASYIKRRAKSVLSPFTSPPKSNITFSGRLLAGLRFSIAQGKAIITPTGQSRGGVDNKEVASYLKDKGRSFLLLSKSQIVKLVEFISKEIFKGV